MSFKSDETRRVASLIASGFFNDPGQGIFFGKPRAFVLSNARLNLWAGIRSDAIDYFDCHDIPWHQGAPRRPTGHVLSSQVACVNHLFFLRQRKDLADAVVRNLGFGMVEAAIVDTGFVEFEVIGDSPYLGERSWMRGASSTSVDAAMLGVSDDGARTLILIEWKYTENYGRSSLYIPQRASVYDPLIRERSSPICVKSPEYLYYEPFYQLMRQTLLGWKMVEHGDYGATRFVHVHVIPRANRELRHSVASPGLPDGDMSEAWRSVLVDPDSYTSVSPGQLLAPLQDSSDCAEIRCYLDRRYGLD